MKNKTLILVVTVFIIGVIVVYTSSKKQDNNKQTALIKLTYAENKVLPFPHPAVIAQNKGFFKEEGLEINVVSFNTGKEAFNAMLSGDAQIAHVAETPIVFLGFTDKNVQIFARIVEGHNVKILARKDKGIEKPSDLKGKRIGGPKGTSAEFALSEFLRINNLNSKDIEFINLNPIALLNAITSDQIDAYVIWEPHIYTGKQSLGNNAVIFPVEKSLYEIQTSLAAKKDWLEKNPEITKKFLRAIIRGEKYIEDNPQESLKIVAEYMGLDESVLNSFKDEYTVKIYLNLKTLPEIMERVGVWVNSQKPEAEKKQLPDYNEFINPQFLREIDSSRIQ